MKNLKELAMMELLRSRLCSDSRTCGQTIDVIVENDNVFLVGVCDSAESQETARMIVRGTYGVRNVVDKLSLRIRQTTVPA